MSKQEFSDPSGAGMGQRLRVVGLVVAAMAVSAAAGAWVQAQRAHAMSAPSLAQQRALGKQLSRDALYLRENMKLLAGRVGEMQARLIALDELGNRVAKAADVAYTDPEIHASFRRSAMDDDVFEGGPGSAKALGDHIAYLEKQVADQGDRFAMLDLVLTKRAGEQARLPTLMPVHYTYLSSPFGWRRDPVTGRRALHTGIDLAAPRGTPIRAASGGVVVKAGYESGYGKMVEISHGNGLDTLYAHASKVDVKVGELVTKGQVIANVGESGRATGAHLHFEVRMAGQPLDPTLFLGRGSVRRLLAVTASYRG
ncbi:MAG TPA: M23 family metallopeptidase [Burkholderiaceae bacterium]|nr:M23 family metallopeptidase [Burkholderiaceae bacterium]